MHTIIETVTRTPSMTNHTPSLPVGWALSPNKTKMNKYTYTYIYIYI